jgi:hypothetical protein
LFGFDAANRAVIQARLRHADQWYSSSTPGTHHVGSTSFKGAQRRFVAVAPLAY